MTDAKAAAKVKTPRCNYVAQRNWDNGSRRNVYSNSECRKVGPKRCTICASCKSHCACRCRCGTVLFGVQTCKQCGICFKCCKKRIAETQRENHEDISHDPGEPRLRNYFPQVWTQPLKFWESSKLKKEFSRNPSKRFVSLELEVSEFRTPGSFTNRAAYQWSCSIVTDGSLHRDTAVEINTSPANGDLLLNQLSDLGEAIRNNGGSCYSDAGMHCHIDARDFRWYDMRRLIFLYEKIELALYSIVPQWRRGNSYCSPCGKYLADALRKTGAVPKESKKGIIGALYGEGFTGDDAEPTEVLTDRYRHGKAQKGMSDRYRGLNLDSWVYRGTVECRIHQGSTRPERMQAWAMMWAAILDYAMKTPEREIIALSGTPLDILRSVPMPSLSLEYINDRTSRFGVAKNFRFPEPPEDSGEDEEPADSYEEPEEPEPPENESLRDYAARTGCNCGVCNEARQQANQQRERGF